MIPKQTTKTNKNTWRTISFMTIALKILNSSKQKPDVLKDQVGFIPGIQEWPDI